MNRFLTCVNLGLFAIAWQACASVPQDTLPRFAHGLDGLKGFYFAVCTDPVPAHVGDCEDAAKYLNIVGDSYNKINDLVGEE